VNRALISKRAQRELRHIREHISVDDPEAAVRVWEAMLETADLRAENPEAGKQIAHAPPPYADVRWFVIPRFRSYLIFPPCRDTILVIRVLHAAQDWTRFFARTSHD
jgi:plasmid stabilization system protein ParE